MPEPESAAPPHLRSWQTRIFSTVWITYFAYYLCRYSMPVAKTRMCTEFGWSKSDFGIILSALLVMYAIGQFVNGQLADRFGTRRIASLGVIGSVAMNVAVFLVVLWAPAAQTASKSVLVLVAVFWGVNGFFQAMGWTPMVRVMAHWFTTESRGRIMGLMGTCYQFGAAASWFLAYFLVTHYADAMGGDWRAVFWVPAVIFSAVGVLFFLLIRNAPEDVDLPPVNTDDHSEDLSPGQTRPSIGRNILRTLRNPYLWVVAGAFFMLDVNRYGFVNWLPAYLDEMEKTGVSTEVAGFGFMNVMKRCILPLAGAAGAIVAGWASDRFFKGRRAPVIAVLLLVLGLSSIAFSYVPAASTWLMLAVLAVIGFCTYGPHVLMVGHAAQDFGKKSGAASAAGFIDGMGYIGAAMTGWGAGALIDWMGYGKTIVLFGAAAIAGAALICIIWQVGPRTQAAK